MISIHSLCPFLVFGLPILQKTKVAPFMFSVRFHHFSKFWPWEPRSPPRQKKFFPPFYPEVNLPKWGRSLRWGRSHRRRRRWVMTWEDRRPETDTTSGWISWLVFVKSLLQSRYLRDYGTQTSEIMPKWSGREPATPSREKKNLAHRHLGKVEKKNFFPAIFFLSKRWGPLNFFSPGRE